MKLGAEILYLSSTDIDACGLSLAEVEAAVEAMFAAKAGGDAVMKPKTGLHAPGGALFLASPAITGTPAVAGIKWIGVAGNQARGLPHIAGLIMLNDGETGMPLAAMDAKWITAVRTAAITAVAARRLARADSAAIGFVACGVQARANLAALAPHFPLTHIRAYGRRRESAEAFAAEARDLGFEAEAVDDPRDAVENMDIVITSTPVAPRTEPFLDAAWLATGSFAGLVDLGVSWHPDTLPALDRVMTDDIAQSGSENVAYPKPFDGEVADLVTGTLTGRETPEERTALVFAGLGLADVAVGAAVYQRALERDVGRVLPL